MIRDFFRTEIHPDNFSPQQLLIVLKKYQKDVDKLEKALCRLANQGVKILPSIPFSQSYSLFVSWMEKWKGIGQFQEIVDNLIAIAPSFHGTLNRQKEVKLEVRVHIEQFASWMVKEEWDRSSFDQVLADGLEAVSILSSENLKSPPLPSFYPLYLEKAFQELLPIVQDARNEMMILARMGAICQELLERYALEEEVFRHDDLIKSMRNAVQNVGFAGK